MRTASLPRSCLLALVAGLLPGPIACSSTPSAAAPTSSKTPAPVPSSTSSKAPTAKKPDSVELPAASRPFVAVSTVDDAAVTPWVRAAARVAFRERGVARVAPAIDGRIVEVHVKAGDVVKAGTPLMTLVSAAAATARADLERARVSLRLAEADAARQAEMVLRGVGIAAEKLAADARVDEARASLEALDVAGGYLGAGPKGAVVLRAPLAGTVLELRATAGTGVTPDGEPVAVIGDPTALWVIAEVFQRDLAQITVGAAVELETSAAPQPITGTVLAVGGALDTTTRRAPVYIALAGADGAVGNLRAGMYARARIAGTIEGGIAVPTSAVLLGPGGSTFVFVQTGASTFTRRPVVIGHPVDGRVPVLDGLRPGEALVTAGALLLDGAVDALL